jgi:hypothetical protein
VKTQTRGRFVMVDCDGCPDDIRIGILVKVLVRDKTLTICLYQETIMSWLRSPFPSLMISKVSCEQSTTVEGVLSP